MQLPQKGSFLPPNPMTNDTKPTVIRKALETAAEFIRDPDENLGMNMANAVYTRPLTTEERLQEEMSRIRRLKEAARLIREALSLLPQ